MTKGLIPWHWSLRGPRRVRNVDGLLRHRNVRGGHVADVYRVLRIGPWSLMLFRYRPGETEETL